MIKVKQLVATWKANEYDAEAIVNEISRLKEALWALYDNGLITKEQLAKEHFKLQKAIDAVGPLYE